ncbi:MAG: aminopeptidase P family protein [Actinobacteria bacterium]|nr:aminopeptidase P family protein [Actinomycetota bacterium]
MLNEIPKTEFIARAKRLQAIMDINKFDFILTFGSEAEPQYVRYFSDYWPNFETAGVLIPIIGDPVLIIGPESETFAIEWSKIDRIEKVLAYRESSEPEYPDMKLTSFNDLFKEFSSLKKFKRIGIVGYPIMTLPVYNAIKESADIFGYELARADKLVDGMKIIKTDIEIEIMKNAAKISEKAFGEALKVIKPGMTEAQVVGEVEYYIRKFGAEDRAYPMFCKTGNNTNQAVSRPSQRKIKNNEMAYFNAAARLGGYSSSIGRPVSFGKPSKKIIDFMKLGREAEETVLGSIKTGIVAESVTKKFKKFLKDHDSEDAFLYGPCHGVGMLENEPPWIEEGQKYLLEENMTFCACVYIQKDGMGLRYEDAFRVKRNGVEEFSNKFKDLTDLIL